MSIDEFLKKIAYDIQVNNKELNEEDFYYILKYIGISKDMSLSEDIAKFYQGFLDSLSDSLIKYETRKTKDDENATYYIGFYVDKKANYEEAVKVYFPVKYEYLISSLKTVFLYLIRNSIKSTVKFCVKATNENIVIRFYNKEDVFPFINYCYKNFILEDLLEKTNPFIACIHGIGLVKDDNSIDTYNGTLSKLLMEYFRDIKTNNKWEEVNEDSFENFIKGKAINEVDEVKKFNISAIYSNISTILNHNEPVI